MCLVYGCGLLVFVLLLMQCIYIYTHLSQNGLTALHFAAQGGNEDVVKLLLEAKADTELIAEVINL